MVRAVWCLCSVLVAVPTPVMAEHADLRVMSVPGGTASSGFEEFFTEYRAMLTGWWRHGNDRANAGTWQVVGAEVKHPGQQRPHFVITLTRETEERSVLIFTFSVPPHAQGEVLLGAHAAYDATVGAILGELRYRGTLEWQGMSGEMVRNFGTSAGQRYPTG